MAQVLDFIGSVLLRVGFDRIKDAEGNISTDEAKQLLQMHLISLKHPFVVAAFDEDKNVTKYNYCDFSKLYKSIKQNAGSVKQADKLQMFKDYDRSNNGFITREDFKLCLREDEYYEEDELDTIIDLVLKFGDLNKDGKLNYIEFVEMLKDEGGLFGEDEDEE